MANVFSDMLDKHLCNRVARSLTPFVSDTDISLTDVSAIGTMSPAVSLIDYNIIEETCSFYL